MGNDDCSGYCIASVISSPAAVSNVILGYRDGLTTAFRIPCLMSMSGKPLVKIGINPHWYSQFWIKQFWQLQRQGVIRLRPLWHKKNPYACFYFEVNGRP